MKHEYSTYLLAFLFGVMFIVAIISGDDEGGTPTTLEIPSISYNSPMLMLPGTNEYITNLMSGGSVTAVAGGADRIDISPYIASYNFTIKEVGVPVSTAVANSYVRVVIYETNTTNGRPTSNLLTSDAIATNTTGLKTTDVDFSFEKGKMYFIGYWHSSNPTLRVGQGTNIQPLSWIMVSTIPTREAVLRTTQAFGEKANDWTYTTSQHTTFNPPLIMMRIA